ncbi:MAG TPA: hypothetical protein VFU27_06485 [Terriglobales bacterium]|nr:hypothetical protein [Terriglobales bacterium]
MMRLVLLTSSLLAFAVSGMAQQSSNPQSSTSKQTAEQTMSGSRPVSSSAKQTQHITGCLQQQNGEYVLKEKDGKVANLTSTLDMASQVGHEVTATGTWQPNTTPTAGIPPKGGAKGEVVDNPNQLLVVGHMKIVAKKCN